MVHTFVSTLSRVRTPNSHCTHRASSGYFFSLWNRICRSPPATSPTLSLLSFLGLHSSYAVSRSSLLASLLARFDTGDRSDPGCSRAGHATLPEDPVFLAMACLSPARLRRCASDYGRFIRWARSEICSVSASSTHSPANLTTTRELPRSPSILRFQAQGGIQEILKRALSTEGRERAVSPGQPPRRDPRSLGAPCPADRSSGFHNHRRQNESAATAGRAGSHRASWKMDLHPGVDTCDFSDNGGIFSTGFPRGKPREPGYRLPQPLFVRHNPNYSYKFICAL